MLNKYNKIINLYLSSIVLLFIIFPFIRLPLSVRETDIQPYAFLFSSLFLLSIALKSYKEKNALKIPIYFLILIMYVIYVFCISTILNSFNLRNIFGYTSVTIFAITGYYFCKYKLLKNMHIYISIIIYFIFGFLQTVLDKSAGEKIIGFSRGISATRGAYSLTPEPSFYSIQLIFMYMLLTINHDKDNLIAKIAIYLLIFIQIVFLSQAITGIIYLFIIASITLLISKNKVLYFASSIFAIISTIVFSTLLNESSRLYSFTKEFYSNPMLTITKDESANQRITDIIISIYGFFKQLPVAFGHGTNSWNTFLNQNYFEFKYIMYPAIWSNKIKSGYGTILFETGWLGFALIIIPYSIYLIKIGKPSTISISLFIPLFMLSAVQISNPLFGFILGVSVYFSNSYRNSNRNEVY